MDEPRILEIGYPRNDVLVNRANDKKFIEEIKTNLNLPHDKKSSCMHQHGETMSL